jgi:hypothetical protein
VPVAGTANAPQVAAKIRASVNGIPILDEELREAMTPYLAELMGVPEDQREAFLANGGLGGLRKRVKRQLTPHLTPQLALDLIDRSWIEDPVERRPYVAALLSRLPVQTCEPVRVGLSQFAQRVQRASLAEDIAALAST